MNQQLNQSFEALLQNIEKYATSKTVVGEPVSFGNVIIIPLVDVSFGAAAGEGGKGGGGGITAKITPSAVLVVVNDTVQLVNVKNQDSVNKLIDLVPGVLNKLGGFFDKNKD
ncbi:MAG: sporulation protein [Defluviitaleaceae bacterium]|nr:sporulation protein [Defluviitaleaceae bacterium]MCL2837365.1 sporulation protein [Defluviitaleaceae bacterium]